MIALYDRTTHALNASAGSILPTLARFVFAATLMFYFWNSGLTKFDGTPFSPGVGCYAQVFPKAMEAVGYDISQM